MIPIRLLLPTTLVLSASPLVAQELPQAAPIQADTPAPLPSPTPTSVVPVLAPPLPTPTPTPTPTATATPRVAPTPAARPSPRPSATPTPSASPSPTAVPTPAVAPAPEPATTPATPPAIASPLPTDDARERGDTPAWPWMLGVGALLVAGIGLWLARRQRTPEDEEIEVAADEPPAVARAVPPIVPEAPPVPATGLALQFRPTRVGFNMLSATAEGELTIVNEGAHEIEDIRLRTALLGAHVGQDADLAGFLAEPIGRPDVPVFSLPAGGTRTVRVLAAAPRATLKTMIAAGRPMFVPVLAINLRHPAGQAARAFAVGAERVDSAKLAPFWLDVPDRAYTNVAARPHGPATIRPAGEMDAGV